MGNEIKKFEDLTTWKEARELNKSLFFLTKEKLINKDYDLARQIRRASISVMANIAEGFGRHGFDNKKQFYIIARGSAAELISHLYAALDENLISESEEEFNRNYIKCTSVSKLIAGMIRTILLNK